MLVCGYLGMLDILSQTSKLECSVMEVPPNTLDKDEVNNNNDMGWRALGGGRGRMEPATTINAGASSWWGSSTQCGGTPRMMAGGVRQSQLLVGWDL